MLQKVQDNRNILDTVEQRELRRIRHILRRDSLLRNIMEGRMLVKTTRGRKHLEMIGDITSKDYVTMKRDAENRSS